MHAHTETHTILILDRASPSHNVLHFGAIRFCPLDSVAEGGENPSWSGYWKRFRTSSLASISSLGLVISMTHLGLSPASILFID